MKTLRYTPLVAISAADYDPLPPTPEIYMKYFVDAKNRWYHDIMVIRSKGFKLCLKGQVTLLKLCP